MIGGMASAIDVYSSVSAGRASLKSAAIHSLQFCWPCFLEVSSHLNVGIVILAWRRAWGFDALWSVQNDYADSGGWVPWDPKLHPAEAHGTHGVPRKPNSYPESATANSSRGPQKGHPNNFSQCNPTHPAICIPNGPWWHPAYLFQTSCLSLYIYVLYFYIYTYA